MLGELYQPRGYALETARAVLEVDKPFACNVASGCTNNCAYCYGPLFVHKQRDAWRYMNFPKKAVDELIQNQLIKGLIWKDENGIEIPVKEPQGVFLSFLTDPMLRVNQQNTNGVLNYMQGLGIRTAILSKFTVPVMHPDVRAGMTIVSLDSEFYGEFEANTTPPRTRLALLNTRLYPWVSMEPYPISDIYRQDFGKFIEHFGKMKFIVFGKWNYDLRSKTEKARQEYRDIVDALEAYCKARRIRLHVKSETLKFINGADNPPAEDSYESREYSSQGIP